MNASEIFNQLCLMPEKAGPVFKRTLEEMVDLVVAIYDDIYTSCIKVYYATYSPTVYKRHGDAAGFNLYSGFQTEILDLRFDALYVPDNLWKYKGISTEEVLNNVTNGQRGSKTRDMPKTGTWPKNWSVQYPNAYSQYHIWSSSRDTIEAILNDFDENVEDLAASLFWGMAAKYI